MVKAANRTRAGLVVVLLLFLAGWLTWAHLDRSLVARETTLKVELFRMRDALDEYTGSTGVCPDSLKMLEGRHLSSIPVDPFTKSTTSWKLIGAKGDRGGFCDVKSGSTLVAQNGSRYADW